MIFTIKFSPPAQRHYRKLPPEIKPRIESALDEIAQDPFGMGLPLQGDLKGFRKFRVGTFRILYQILPKEIVVIVIRIDHRKDVYR